MNGYAFVLHQFNSFVDLFPVSLHWIVGFLIVVGLIGAVVSLIRQHVIFVLLAVLVLPFLIPAVGQLSREAVAYFNHVLTILHLTPTTRQPPIH